MSIRRADERPARRRVFFALWPDAATCTALVRATRAAVRRSGGRPIGEDKLHMTVAFLGWLSDADLERAARFERVAASRFELVVDRLGHWAHNGVLWAAPARVPRELTSLEAEVWETLGTRGFEREARVYRPHLTLARKARAVDVDMRPVRWDVERFALVESVPAGGGVLYRRLASWPLACAP